MKLKLLFFALTFAFSLNAQTVEPAPEDKAVVYFVRSSGVGALINFTYFDGTNAIGRFNGGKYMRYECDPGEHLLWARSENRDFVKANLEAGKIYLVHVVPMMGAIKASVALMPINDAKYKTKQMRKLLSKRPPVTFTKSELSDLQNEMKSVIERGMEKYKKMSKVKKRLGGFTFTPDQLVYLKK